MKILKQDEDNFIDIESTKLGADWGTTTGRITATELVRRQFGTEVRRGFWAEFEREMVRDVIKRYLDETNNA